jgi:hypothetical protein
VKVGDTEGRGAENVLPPKPDPWNGDEEGRRPGPSEPRRVIVDDIASNEDRLLDAGIDAAPLFGGGPWKVPVL